MRTILPAVAVALLGSLFFALGAALQQFEAVRGASVRSLAGNPRWLLGGLAIAAGMMYGTASTLVRVLVDGGWDWWVLDEPLPENQALAVAAVALAATGTAVLARTSPSDPYRAECPAAISVSLESGSERKFPRRLLLTRAVGGGHRWMSADRGGAAYRTPGLPSSEREFLCVRGCPWLLGPS